MIRRANRDCDNLSGAGWYWGCVSAFDSQGCTIWIVDAHGAATECGSSVRADEKLTAFIELESVIRSCGGLCLTGK
jgi:hypothetical protein